MKSIRSTTTSALAVLAIASLTLTACGRDADGGADEGQGEAIAEGEASGTIEVWAMGTEGDALGDFAAAFEEENPDATVDVTAIPWDAAHDKIANAISAGETPDVTLVGTTWMGEFAQSGGRTWSTTPTSSRAPGAPPRSAARRTASRGTSRPASSTTARTWPRRPAGARPPRPGTR
jgi:ABC-type glycerol-3-phosphate transport system substrate-binding protein